MRTYYKYYIGGVRNTIPSWPGAFKRNVCKYRRPAATAVGSDFSRYKPADQDPLLTRTDNTIDDRNGFISVLHAASQSAVPERRRRLIMKRRKKKKK